MVHRLQHALQRRVKHAVQSAVENAAMSMKTRIRDRMDELQVNVANLAKASGVSRSAVYQWLDGSTEPSITALVKMADKLKTYEKWLVMGQSAKDRGSWVALAPDEAALLLAYKDLNKDTKEAVYAVALQLSQSEKAKQKSI